MNNPVLLKLPEFSKIGGNEKAILGHFGYQTIFDAKRRVIKEMHQKYIAL